MARRLSVLVLLAALGGALAGGCGRIEHKVERLIESSGVAAASTSRPTPPAPGPAGTLDVRARHLGPHPRILLTPERLARLTALHDPGTASWNALLARCRKDRAEVSDSGYEGWDWANDALALALCSKVTKDPGFAAMGVKYFTALLDDKLLVGDHKGGDAVVQHDEGYSIRTHGALGAIAYDWLYDAPGMTPALRRKAVDRFAAWTSWFKESGYNHDQPISNYYAGYFGAVAFAGLACAGDDPRADAFAQRTQEMWNHEIVPVYRTKLAGGDFPEGWQYGSLVGTLFAIYADAETNAHPPAATSPFTDLTWLHESVTHRAFALYPDGTHTYDNGDWSHSPAVAPPELLFALATVLPASDPAKRQAEFLARLAREDSAVEMKWLQAIADDPARPAEDPRKGQASYLSPGTATVLARSSFSPNALWFSLASAPSLSDHQHLDAGHFEVVRGADRVFVNAGDYASYSSLSHNVVIVDDPLQSPDWETSKAHRDVITYKRNQGLWSHTAHIERFEDGGSFVYALAQYDSAYNPKGYPEDRHDRAVTRAEREVIFSRTPVAGAGTGESGRVVVLDRFTMSDPRFTTTFILHGGAAPQISGPLARFATGRAAAWVTTLLPKGATTNVVNESPNKNSDDRPYFTNTVPEGIPSFRYEVASPTSPPSTERRFLHAIVVGAQGANLPPGASPVSIEGDGATGAAIDGEAYVFASAGPATQASALSYVAPVAATRHVVTDLAPSAPYAIAVASAGSGCKVTLTPGAGKTASAKGVLAIDLAGCALKP